MCSRHWSYFWQLYKTIPLWVQHSLPPCTASFLPFTLFTPDMLYIHLYIEWIPNHKIIWGQVFFLFVLFSIFQYSFCSFWNSACHKVLSKYTRACVLSLQLCPICVTLWPGACQTFLSMGFSRQECWSGLPCPYPGYLASPGIEPVSLRSPALAGGFFTTSTTWKAQ